jgi:ribosome-binding factor A
MLASEIRKLIAPFLRQCPPECGIVTITEVEVSPDSSVIIVRVSALKHHEMALEFMRERKGEMRHALKALHMHRLPELRFEMDLRSEQGSRIEKILSEESSH